MGSLLNGRLPVPFLPRTMTCGLGSPLLGRGVLLRSCASSTSGTMCPPPTAHFFIKRELERQGREVLDEQVSRIEGVGVEVAGVHLREGRISDEVISLSEELGVGLLVVGGRGQGRIERILMGSHSEDIVHCAHLPVLVLRHGAVWPPTRLVIGDDYSEDAREAASLARGLGEHFWIREAVLVHAYPPLLEEVSEAEVTGYAVKPNRS